MSGSGGRRAAAALLMSGIAWAWATAVEPLPALASAPPLALTPAIWPSPAAAVAQDVSPPQGETSARSEAELDRLTAEVADRLRCPVCRNQSILESPSELAREMQAVIRERLAAGESPEEVKAYFVSRYGEWVLLKPEPRGATLLVYVLPALAFLLGGGLVGWRLRRWAADRRARAAPAAGGARADAAGRTTAQASEPAARDFSAEEEAWLRDAIARER